MTSFRENLYHFLSEYIHQNGNSPSFAQITEAMGISPRSKSLISRSLRILEKEKKIVLVKEGRRLLITLSSKKIPLLGRISAGLPIEAIADCQLIEINDWFLGSDRFALQVKGTSMVDEGILEGDIIICVKAQSADEGDIVVALIDQDNATLKRISYQLKNKITLVPANSALKPQVYAPERVCIQGVYLGLVRKV